MDKEAARQTILIVDDNPTNLGVVVDYLEQHNFHIVIARDGETAIKRAQYVRPKVILLDVMMPPGIDGFETCRRLKANSITRDIPVIFMTALARVEDKVEGFAAGAVDYVTKPIQQEEVLARVNTHLTLQAQKKHLEKMTRDLQKTNQNLAELVVNKDKFFAIIAHDLRTPFNTLIGYSQLLMTDTDRYSREEISSLVREIYLSASNTFDLLQNLLKWAMLQQGQLMYQPGNVTLNELVLTNIQVASGAAKQKNITINNRVPEDLTVFVDSDMINTVIRNLLTNSIKFTPDGGHIAVVGELENGKKSGGRWAKISVTDTGVGMSSAVIEKLFRLDVHHTSAGTRDEKGTGLGLILCKEMIALHGGTMNVHSVPDQGTAIEFTVPLAA